MSLGTILVADDDVGLLSVITTRLEHDGYRVVTCRDGYQTIAAARRELPDLLILDINMPAGNGFSVHERINAIEELRTTPVMYMTGRDSQEVYDKADSMGAIAVLQKPFDGSFVVQAVHSCLEHAHHTSEENTGSGPQEYVI